MRRGAVLKPAILLLTVALASGQPRQSADAAARPGSQGAAETARPVDVVVVDRDGRFVGNLGTADFAVTVDNQPRRVLRVRRVSRGPGATTDAMWRQTTSDGAVSFAAEPRRNAVIVVDESTLLRGDEGGAVKAAAAFLDRLGIDDRIAVLRIPTSSDTPLTLTTERPASREALSRVVGQLVPGRMAATDDVMAPPDRSVAVDPDREKAINPERLVADERPPPVVAPVSPEVSDQFDPVNVPVNLVALRGLFRALQAVPGRKVVALFSAGVVGPTSAHVAEISAVAVAARATVYAFGLRASRDDPRRTPDVQALEALATATGGAYAELGRSPDRAVERAVSELSACYVLGIEAGPADDTGRRRALRVNPVSRGLTVRAPRWLPPSSDAGDTPVAPAGSADALPAAAPLADVVPGPVKRSRSDPAREAELQLALARLADYIEGYERQYSALVAEEDYRQSLPSGITRRLRSDFLFVRQADEWTSFRDVFEVDGHSVRDREDRLKRLFLDPTPEARQRLKAVIDESARYNIGPVLRTINVPLFPLSFMKTYNRMRFEFRLGGQRDSAGVRVWRIVFDEHMRPTLVADLEDNDVPVTGWFLVDQMTGALVETGIVTSRGSSTGEIVVRYRRDPSLGLWVPAEMRETYRTESARLMDAEASYSNFRRFQVKTEETITLPKK